MWSEWWRHAGESLTRRKLCAGSTWSAGGGLGRHADVVESGPGRWRAGWRGPRPWCRTPPRSPRATVRPSLRTSEIWSTVVTWTWSTRRVRSWGSAEITFAASWSAAEVVPIDGLDAGQPGRRLLVVAEDDAVGVHAAQPAADLDHRDRDPLLDRDQDAVGPLPGDRHGPDDRQRTDPPLGRRQVDADQRLTLVDAGAGSDVGGVDGLGAADVDLLDGEPRREPDGVDPAADERQDQHEHEEVAPGQPAAAPLPAGEPSPAAPGGLVDRRADVSPVVASPPGERRRLRTITAHVVGEQREDARADLGDAAGTEGQHQVARARPGDQGGGDVGEVGARRRRAREEGVRRTPPARPSRRGRRPRGRGRRRRPPPRRRRPAPRPSRSRTPGARDQVRLERHDQPAVAGERAGGGEVAGDLGRVVRVAVVDADSAGLALALHPPPGPGERRDAAGQVGVGVEAEGAPGGQRRSASAR